MRAPCSATRCSFDAFSLLPAGAIEGPFKRHRRKLDGGGNRSGDRLHLTGITNWTASASVAP